MIIAVTADNHVSQMSPTARMNFDAMLMNVTDPSNKVDVFCVAGDLRHLQVTLDYDLLLVRQGLQ